ncbi:MAG: hypothetical protein JNG89_01410 [Planctomycetaceae bacterium]|nr:hypothetical protein [Planctomycetaceae bacterium]
MLIALSAAGGAVAGAADAPESEGTIEIREIEWGFDGKSPVQTFVPLSLLVENTGATPAKGALRLKKSVGRNQRVDVEYEQTYFISGFSSRWVQLTPYVIGDFEQWTLSWGPQFRNKVEVPTPRMGERATVLIAEENDTTAIGSVLRRCDPALFPTSVTGTDSLRGIVLHAVPSWQGARIQAFLDWLQRGGRLFLVHGADGEYPRFSGELAVLNDARDETRFGSGRITRIPLSVDDIDADTARQLILEPQPADRLVESLDSQVQRMSGNFPVSIEFDDYILRDLMYLTRFHRNWWVVYLAAVLYVLAVFPGSYLLGRRSADWRWFYAGFLGISVVFSAGFARLGQLGSSERSRTRSVAVAYQLADRMFDVTQYTCAASRNGDVYSLTTDGSGRLFTSCQDLEPVKGVARLADGVLDLDLPSASTCRILQRARMPGPALDVQARELEAGDGVLRNLVLSFGPDVYHDSMLACAWYDGTIHEMEAGPDGARLTTNRAAGSQFINTLDATPWKAQRQLNIWTSTDIEPATTTEAFQRLMAPLVGSTLRLPTGTYPKDVRLDPAFVRVLLFRTSSDEFQFEGNQFPDQEGYVLYVVDLPVAPGAP